MRKVIITGCSGFVGRNMAKHFLSKGDYVIGLSRRNPNIPGLNFIKFDLTTDMLPEKYLDFDVVHCGAYVHDDSNLLEALKVNVVGTERMLRVNPKGHFVHISSSSIYDLSKSSKYSDEDSFKPGSLPHYYNSYAHTKALAETLLLSKSVEREVHPVSLRPHGIYGEDDTTLIPRILGLIKNGSIRLPKRGNPLHTLTNINNLIHAVELSLEYKGDDVHSFNITDSNAVSIAYATQTAARMPLKFNNISKTLLEFLPKSITRVSDYQLQQLCYDRTYSIEKARELLRYNPAPFQMEWIK